MNISIKKIRAYLHTYRLCLRKFRITCVEPIFHFFPIKNKILFANFMGKGLGDDPKYILLELLKRENHPDLYWVVSNKNIIVPEGVHKVKYFSVKYVYHLCTSKVWVFNIKNMWKVRKRKGQYYLQTWHASLALKNVEKSVATTLDDYCDLSQKDSKMIDLLYANNNKEIEVFKKDFWYDGPIIKTDVPRTGILINPQKGLKDKIGNALRFNSSKKIILYAPTFRKLSDISLYIWDYNRVITELSRRFGEDYVFLLRLHPNITSLATQLQYNNQIINATSYPDMQELLAVSDILLNDYSSSMFEFGYLRKPVFLYAKDRIEYTTSDRSLLFDLSDLPFSFSESLDELCDNIKAFDPITYKLRCDDFYKKIGFEDNGNGASIISEIIMNQFKTSEIS